MTRMTTGCYQLHNERRRQQWGLIMMAAAVTLLVTLPTTRAFAPTVSTRIVHNRRSSLWLRSSSKEDAAPCEPPTEWKGQVLETLSSVIDPDLGSDIVTLGFVQNLRQHNGQVAFDVELTTPACPVKEEFRNDCIRLVQALPWVDSVQVNMTAQELTETASSSELPGLARVGAIIAVASCKGGVGKSTTAVNLAFTLAQSGATVGILDADVYGPSLPVMVTPDDDVVRFVGRQVAPLQRNGVRLMSFGYVNEGSAVMRGPMVTQLLDQFLAVTAWGKLDYLVLDMPPGTGDVQLTLTQRLNLTAAVIVTTPTELSFADVVRGVEMFDSVQVPSVAVVENMAYYEAPTSTMALEGLETKMYHTLKASLGETVENTDKLERAAADLVKVVEAQQQEQQSKKKRIPIFGAGHRERLAQQWGIEHTFSVPLMDDIAANGDAGVPFVLQHPDSDQAGIYRDLANAVVQEVAKRKFNNTRTSVELEDNVFVVDHKYRLPPVALRRACRCAACVEEMTGRQILNPTTIPDSIQPVRIAPTGNYALSVDWEGGHRSLYPYRQILALVEELASEESSESRTTEKAAQVV